MGLITFNLATLKKSNYQPKVIFSSLHYSGRRVGTYPAQGKSGDSCQQAKSDHHLRITRLSAQSIRPDTSIAWMVSTAPGEWISNGSSNVIGFNRINHGDYVLKVRATNSHGVWSKYVAELPIEVRPTFWESIWGKFSCCSCSSVS